MDPSEIWVVVGGVVLIGATYWYFFGNQEKTAAKESNGVQEVTVTVQGGYSPDTILVKKDKPVRIHFKREEDASCSEKVIFSDFGIVKDLPAFETTTVEFTPFKTGEFLFTCGMNMMRGKLIVR